MTHAFLVGWLDFRTGKWVDAGIYCEAAPTGDLRGPRPVVLLSSVSRFGAAAGGYDRARETLTRLAHKTPELKWTTQMRTFRSQGALKLGARVQGKWVRSGSPVR